MNIWQMLMVILLTVLLCKIVYTNRRLDKVIQLLTELDEEDEDGDNDTKSS